MSTFAAPCRDVPTLPAALGLDGRRNEGFFARVAAQDRLRSAIALAAAVVVVGSAGYGFTFGLWRSPLLACYVAVKLPVLLVATTSLVMLLNWMIAQLMASGLGFWQVAALTYRAMAAASLVLASLAPVSAFMALACPPPQPRQDLAHNVLLLVHVACVGCAGAYGNSTLLRGLTRLCRPGTPVRRLYACWLASNVLVGCQFAWILRPFLGSPNYPVAFLRPDALEGNFFEFVFVTIVWKRLLGG
ncbi:MAG TPA: hypothetical protein VG125_18430 [Pirellulales bacterium]|jgi:hypothetical protein|nr:hypothetical protein [Pirellulales bacterium]